MNYHYRRSDKKKFQIVLLVLVLSLNAGDSSADHGLILDGTLNYKKEFDLFDWASVEAVKGGELILHAIRSLDKITPFPLKGGVPEGLYSFYEPLTFFSFDEPFLLFAVVLPKEVKTAVFNDGFKDVRQNQLRIIKNPVVGCLVEKIIYAQSNDDLTAASKALDRVVWHGYHVVPNWYPDSHRMACHNKFMMPRNLSIYHDYRTLVMTWWGK